MKKMVIAVACLFVAACGDGSITTTQTTGTPKTTLLAVMGTFSTATNEYPITIKQSYSAFAGSIFFNVSSVSISLKNDMGQEYPFTSLRISNTPDPDPPKGWEYLPWTVLTGDFVTSSKPPAGIYTLHTVFNFPAVYGIHSEGFNLYTVQ